MQFIHSFGLTHTDLKLENILFNSRENKHSLILNYLLIFIVQLNRLNESVFLPESTDITGLILI